MRLLNEVVGIDVLELNGWGRNRRVEEEDVGTLESAMMVWGLKGATCQTFIDHFWRNDLWRQDTTQTPPTKNKISLHMPGTSGLLFYWKWSIQGQSVGELQYDLVWLWYYLPRTSYISQASGSGRFTVWQAVWTNVNKHTHLAHWMIPDSGTEEGSIGTIKLDPCKSRVMDSHGLRLVPCSRRILNRRALVLAGSWALILAWSWTVLSTRSLQGCVCCLCKVSRWAFVAYHIKLVS